MGLLVCFGLPHAFGIMSLWASVLAEHNMPRVQTCLRSCVLETKQTSCVPHMISLVVSRWCQSHCSESQVRLRPAFVQVRCRSGC